MGFAVPIDTVNRVVPQLIARGKYIRPGLGIAVDDGLNRAAMEQLLAMGQEDGLTEAVGQIDAILSQDPVAGAQR